MRLPLALMVAFATSFTAADYRALVDAYRKDGTPQIEHVLGLPAADIERDVGTALSSSNRTRYLLTHTPQGVDKAGWHPIEVSLKSKNGRVTARRGYLK